jgi:hypothetical protein
MEPLTLLGLSEELGELYIIDETPDISTEPEEEEDDEEESEAPLRKYDEKPEEKIEKYSEKFEIPASGLYMDEDENSLEMEYDVLYEEIFPEDSHRIREEDYKKDPEYQTEFNFPPEDDDNIYSDIPKKPDAYLSDRDSYRSDVLSIEYEKPEMVGGQKTYQRLIFRADSDGESVYELAMRKFQEAGMEISAEYDEEFESMLFTSVNGRHEGEEGNFNEFYLNGDIGMNAVDKELLKAGDVVELRYAEETDGSCGGVPDYGQIKSSLEYNAFGERIINPPGFGSIFLYGG